MKSLSPTFRNVAGLAAGALFCCVLMGYGVTQEVPIGQVAGKVVMAEDGKPLPEAFVSFTPLGQVDDDIIRPRYTETKADGTFSIQNLPADIYEMDISATHHNLKTRYVIVEEGKVTDLSTVKMQPVEPYLRLYASQRVFTPGEQPHIEMHGFVKADDVRVEIYRLNLGAVAAQGGLQEALYPLGDKAKLDKGVATEVRNSMHKVAKRDAEGAFIEDVQTPPLDEGFYYVRVSVNDIKAATYLNITKLAMVTKTAKQRTLAYVADILTGKPVEGAQLLSVHSGNLVPVATTDANGTGFVQSQKTNRPVVLAKKGSSFAMVGFYGGEESGKKLRTYTYTERPIYRPGDEIHFKGVIRKLDGDNLALPGNGSAQVELRNNDGDVADTQTLPISAHGTYAGTFKTADEAEPGDWNIVTKAFGEESSQYVPVSAYRKPEYSVTVEGVKPYYIVGQKAAVKVKAEYYFGGPVIGAKVHAYIYRSPVWSYGDDEEEDWGGNEFVGGEFSDEIDAVTDANGEAIIEFETRVDGDPELFPTDFTYSVMASVADEGDKSFSGEGAVDVVRGAFALDVQADSYVGLPNQPFSATVTAKSHEGHPLAGRAIEVTLGRDMWTKRTSVFVPVETKNVVTDASGTARISFTAGKAGDFKILAKAKDQDGNDINSTATIWIDGEGATWGPDLGDFRLLPDKREYKPGETAKVLLQTSAPGGSVLLTVEADEVMWQKVVPLANATTTVELGIASTFAPDAFVTAAYIKSKKYFTDSKHIRIGRPDRELKVKVTPSKTAYEPGDQVELTVETKDDAGKPAPAEVSLGVVDESIYAIREDDTDIVTGLYPRRYNQVQTNYSFPDIYLDGGDKGGNMPLRSKFKDTAFWVPAVQTDAKGTAKITFQLPDNLTEWRATAVGVTDQSVAGMADVHFKARKDLMVRLQPPMYMVRNESQRMAVIVTNDTGKDQDVNVRVEATGISLDGKAEQTIRVAAGKPEALSFTLNATESGEATLTARAWVNGGASDGVQQKLAIKPYGRLITEEKAGETPSSATETLTLRPGSDPNTGELIVNVSPSLASGVVQSLPALVDFPYGCVEQTMSRFMPSMVVSSAIKNLHVQLPGVAQKLPKIADESYARLAKMQHYDGGWGWWENDSSSPFMTALVLDGVDRAKRAGYEPKYIDVPKAVEKAIALMRTPPKEQFYRQQWERDRLYLAYALSRHGKKEIAAEALKRIKVKTLGNSELGLLALTAKELGDAGAAEAALERLKEVAQVGNVTASWAPQEYAWGSEPTALALTAFVAIRPADPIIPKAVRFLMLNRKGDIWLSTRDTSYSVIALTNYLTQHPEEISGSGQVRVRLNGREIGLGHGTIRVATKYLKTGDNVVQVDTVGGRAYYTVRLQQFDTEADMGAEPGKGISVERHYYLLEPQRLENGDMKLLPSKQEITSVKSGQLVRVVLTIRSDIPRQYIMLEDPLPSNFRAMERGELDSGEEWGWWWSKTVLRDDRITFFATYLNGGESKIEYTMRAESPGTGIALPSRLENMYDPSQSATGPGMKLEVTR
jgi:uncharacterized protein YfaS (alpha-2-macroglobulin family)